MCARRTDDPQALTKIQKSCILVAPAPKVGILASMRPRVTVHLNGKRWVFTMDSPKQYNLVKYRIQEIMGDEGVDMPNHIVAGDNVVVQIPLFATDEYVDEYVEENRILTEVRSAFPNINNDVMCPCDCWHEPQPLYDVIIHLNDNVGWSRNKIADWIETLDFKVESCTMT